MADLYYVMFNVNGEAQRVNFEILRNAKEFADGMVELGHEVSGVYDEFDPRRLDDDGEVEDIPPVYDPTADAEGEEAEAD